MFFKYSVILWTYIKIVTMDNCTSEYHVFMINEEMNSQDRAFFLFFSCLSSNDLF